MGRNELESLTLVTNDGALWLDCIPGAAVHFPLNGAVVQRGWPA